MTTVVSVPGTPGLGQAAKAGSLPVTLASDEDLKALIGALADAAAGDATGSVIAHLRYLAAILGVTTDASAQDAAGTLNAHARGIAKAAVDLSTNLLAILGATTGAAVTSDAAGTIQQYLRGHASLIDTGGDTVAAGLNQMRVGAHLRAYNGATWDRLRYPNVVKSFAVTAITAGTPVTVWTPASGKKFRLMGYAVLLTVAAQVIFKDGGNADAEIFRERNSTSTSQTAVGLGTTFALGAAANGALKIDVSASASVSGFVIGCEE